MATTFRNDVTSYDAADADLMEWVPDLMAAHVGADVRADAHRPAAPARSCRRTASPSGVRRGPSTDGVPPGGGASSGTHRPPREGGSDARPPWPGPVRAGQPARDAAPRVRGTCRSRRCTTSPGQDDRASPACTSGCRSPSPGSTSTTRTSSSGSSSTRGRAAKGPVIGRGVPGVHAHEREGGAWQGGRSSATPTGRG